MIYVSSACSSQKKIGDAILELVDNGFYKIELTGGTQYYEDYEKDILKLKEKYNLSYILHNYFPPPQNEFVLNLASLDENIFINALNNLKQAILLSKKLGAKKFGFHAGFLFDIKPEELGGRLNSNHKFVDNTLAIDRFCYGFSVLKKYSEGIDLYVENNNYSYSNYKIYKENNPFMLTNYADYVELKKKIDFKLLFDIAHLYVVSHALNINFDSNFEKMFNASNYIHISNNDGYNDQNKGINEESYILSKLKNYNLRNKTITLEIYSGMKFLRESYYIVQNLI